VPHQQRVLRNNSGEIMRRLDEGEAFVVTLNGVPVGELVPLRRTETESICGHDAGGGGGGGPIGKSGGVGNHVQEPVVLVRLVMCQSHSSREPSG